MVDLEQTHFLGIEASEINDKFVQISLVLRELDPKLGRFEKMFSNGKKLGFEHGNKVQFQQQDIKIECEIIDKGLDFTCSVTSDKAIYKLNVDDFPDAIIAKSSFLLLKRNMVQLKLAKSPGSASWRPYLATKSFS